MNIVSAVYVHFYSKHGKDIVNNLFAKAKHVYLWEGYGNRCVCYPKPRVTWAGYGSHSVRAYVCCVSPVNTCNYMYMYISQLFIDSSSRRLITHNPLGVHVLECIDTAVTVCASDCFQY